MFKGVDCFPLRKKNSGVYCFRVLSLKKKQQRETMIEVHKKMTPCRDRGTASGRQLRKGIWGWLSRKDINHKRSNLASQGLQREIMPH